MRRIAILLLLPCLAATPGLSADWPEWRGAGRAGVWNEKGVLNTFPADGLTYTWRVPIHEGYAGPAVAAGRVFVADFIRGKGMKGTERALCLSESTGKLLWKQEWPVDYSGTETKWANGPRATPTVDGEIVYFLGGMGKLLALDTGNGRILWSRDFVADYEATVSAWGVVSAPIVHGRLLIALVGGEENATVVAFDKRTGEEVWRALPSKGEPGYAPPIIIEAGGVEQLIVWLPDALRSLDPATGSLYWKQPMEVGMAMTVATPVVAGNRVLVSSFFDGSMLVALDGKSPAARLVWRKGGISEQPQETESLHALITTPVIVRDQIYGICSYGQLRALQASSGERVWESLGPVGEKARWAAGMIVRHGDRFFINTDRGELVIARLTPRGYEEIDRTALIEPTTAGGGRRERDAVHWSHPAYANRHIVVRNDKEIVRASLESSP